MLLLSKSEHTELNLDPKSRPNFASVITYHPPSVKIRGKIGEMSESQFQAQPMTQSLKYFGVGCCASWEIQHFFLVQILGED